MRKIGLLVVMGLAILILGCNRGKGCYWTLPPNVLFFIVHKNGMPLEDSVNAKLKMFYLDGTQRNYRPAPNLDDSIFLSPAYRFSGGMTHSKVLSSAYIMPEYANVWYLESPNGDIDTVTIQIRTLEDCKEAQQNRCYCTRPYTSVTFNGREAPEYMDEQTDGGKIIYLFEK